MNRVALITPMLQPYRISFYEKLAFSDPSIHWVIFHGISSSEDGRPGYRGDTAFSNMGFREYKYNLGPFTLVYNRGLFTQVRKFDPHLIILQGIAGDLANRRITSWARRNRKKIILWTCGWEPGRAKGPLLVFKNTLVSTFFRKADLHLTYSSKAIGYVESMGVDHSRIRTCYNGIETDHLRAKEAAVMEQSKAVAAKFELDGFTTFLYVGGLLPEKRIDLLLEAFEALRQKYRDIKLLIIGDGPLRMQVEERIEAMDESRVSYLGRIIEDVDPYFAASDCLVMPGVGGLALNQAMFWKKTCIVSEADGTEDDLVIENDTGFRFEKDNLESLIHAMERRIGTRPEEIQRMALKAREIIDTKSNVNNMVSVFMAGVAELVMAENEEKDDPSTVTS